MTRRVPSFADLVETSGPAADPNRTLWRSDGSVGTR